jgi:hypothetical protein
MSTVEELRDWMNHSGFGHLAIMGTGKNIFLLDIDLAYDGSLFRVGCSERGQLTETWLQTEDEDEACAIYKDRILGIEWFCASFSENKKAEDAEELLSANGIPARRNDVPPDYHGNGQSFRLFCSGSHLLKARTLLLQARLTY